MSEDDIKRLWRQNGLQFGGQFGWESVFAFVLPILEAERKACVQACHEVGRRYFDIQKASDDTEGSMIGLTGEIAAQQCANAIHLRNGLGQ